MPRTTESLVALHRLVVRLEHADTIFKGSDVRALVSERRQMIAGRSQSTDVVNIDVLYVVRPAKTNLEFNCLFTWRFRFRVS